MVEKDYKLYGTKILNLKTQEIGLLMLKLILQLVLIGKAKDTTLNLII